METKIQRAIYCLYGVIVATAFDTIKLASLGYSVLKDPEIRALTGYTGVSGFGIDIAYGVIVILSSFFIVPALKAKSKEAWVATLVTFFITIASVSYAFPFSILGIVFLLDRDVRTHFIKELDIKL